MASEGGNCQVFPLKTTALGGRRGLCIRVCMRTNAILSVRNRRIRMRDPFIPRFTNLSTCCSASSAGLAALS